jgi:hypothetical protein
LTARFDGARTMDILTFQQRVVEAYQTVLEEMMVAAPTHMVRFWAFLPGIHDDLGVGLVADDTAADLGPLLSKFRELRIYHPRANDAPAIAALVQTYFPSSCRIELAQASLCRPELLIEIEGLATLRPRVSRSPSRLTLES